MIHRPISQSQLLYEACLRNVYNGHSYLLVNRLNSVLMEGISTDLFKALASCMFRENGEPASSPFSQTNEKFYKRNKYFFQNKCGNYSTVMKIPSHLEKHQKNSRFMHTWPYFLVPIYNKLPRNVRSCLGTYQYKNEAKSYFNYKCQHPYRKDIFKN